MNILVLGGTRFFGKILVTILAQAGHSIVVASRRPFLAPGFPNVNSEIVDRRNAADLTSRLSSRSYDIVYDMIGYNDVDMQILLQSLGTKIGRLIFVSSQSVYDSGGMLSEGEFNAKNFSNEQPCTSEYQKGKRLAERVLALHTEVPSVSVRFPIVLSKEDYTRRLHWHVERVSQSKPIYLENSKARMGFISAPEASEFLAWVGASSNVGPLNAISDGFIEIGEILSFIERKVKKEWVRGEASKDEHESPFNISSDWCMSNALAKSSGFRFKSLQDWLPGLVDDLFTDILG
jgi:nucleoside-diphosphate-sugar epimerase